MGKGVGPCPACTHPPARSFVPPHLSPALVCVHPSRLPLFAPLLPPALVRDAFVSARTCPPARSLVFIPAHSHLFNPPTFRPPSSTFTPPIRLCSLTRSCSSQLVRTCLRPLGCAEYSWCWCRYCCCSHWGCADVQARLFARSCPSLSPSLPSWAIPWYLYQIHG
jgi:hypothetical protein